MLLKYSQLLNKVITILIIFYLEQSITLCVNIGAYNLKAIVLRELKRYSKALEYIDKAIELEPNVIFFGIINHLYYPI